MDPHKWDEVNKRIQLKKHVEPDLVIEYSNNQNRSRFYIIEVKWDSPESDQELYKQWHILDDAIQQDAQHIFLVKDEPTTCSRSKENIIIRLWPRLISELQNFSLPGVSSQFQNWQKYTIEFLEKIARQFRHFSGFSGFRFCPPKAHWHFQTFDTSIITSYYKHQLPEQIMASVDGTTITQATESIIGVWEEIHALEREVGHFLKEELESDVKEIEPNGFESEADDETGSVCTKHLWQYMLPRKRGKKYFCVTYYLMLLGDQESFPGMDEPTILVALGEHDEFGMDCFDWQDIIEEDEQPEVELLCGNKLQLWADDAYYAVPLTAIKTREDIRSQLIAPIAAQILERLELSEEDETERTFLKANYLLTFEHYKKGVKAVKHVPVDD